MRIAYSCLMEAKRKWITNMNTNESENKTNRCPANGQPSSPVSGRRLRLQLLCLWHHPALRDREQEPLDDGLALSQIRQ